jgi:hypothetical protein
LNKLPPTLRSAVVWVVPFAVLALVILWQVDWGRAFLRAPPPDAGAVPQPLAVALLPEWQAATSDGSRDTVERTLFNPTRRPAPVALADSARPRIQRGQFALSGTLMVDGKAIAFLREVQGGKSRRVTQGENVNGMVVTEIRTDRIRLSVGDESEELTLKIATGPRTTIQPVMPGGPVSATGVPPVPPGAGPIAGARDVAEVLAERRRAARALEAATAGSPPGTPVPGATSAPITAPTMPAPPVASPSTDPQWQDVYRRYQQRR